MLLNSSRLFAGTIITLMVFVSVTAYQTDVDTSKPDAKGDNKEADNIPIVDSNDWVFPDNPITNDAGGTFNFDRDEHLAQMPGVSVVGTMTNDGINDGSNSDNMGAHVHVFPSDTDGQDILNGVSWVDAGDFSDSASSVGMFGTEGNMMEQIVPDGGGKSQHDSTSFNGVGPSDIELIDDENLYKDGIPSFENDDQDLSKADQHIVEGTSDVAPQIWQPINCYVNGMVYEEGSGMMSIITPCLMYICEAGQMSKYPTACLMNGVCHAEGTNWTSGCVEYTCMLTSAGFRSVEINKGCEFQRRKTGEKKCLKDGEIVRDGPCKKRRCKISKANGKIVTELPLLQDIGGCGYAKGCRSLGEIWTYRCVVKRCISDGLNFYKLPLHARCIRKGSCYDNGQSYTTPRTCVTRTCFVNNFINIAWFHETGRGCRFEGMCINEGDKKIQRCKEFTCTRKMTINGKMKMVMKKTNDNGEMIVTGYS